MSSFPVIFWISRAICCSQSPAGANHHGALHGGDCVLPRDAARAQEEERYEQAGAGEHAERRAHAELHPAGRHDQGHARPFRQGRPRKQPADQIFNIICRLLMTKSCLPFEVDLGIKTFTTYFKASWNEKQWGSGRSQMLGNGLGPWGSRFIYNFNTQLLNKNDISFFALSSKMNKRLLWN